MIEKLFVLMNCNTEPDVTIKNSYIISDSMT